MYDIKLIDGGFAVINCSKSSKKQAADDLQQGS